MRSVAVALAALIAGASERPGIPHVPNPHIWFHQAPAPGHSDSLVARAESLLAAGNLVAARRVAESLDTGRAPGVRVLVLLARIHIAWPVIGRLTAESLLNRAIRLEPDNPEPHYLLGHVGLALMGDDGESIARRGLVRALALDPRYRDVWPMWLRLYRGDRERREGLAALEPHAGTATVDGWRAQLLLELRRRDEAALLLRRIVAGEPEDPAPRAMLARALFEESRDGEAAAVYEEALRLAHLDSAAVLWNQIRSIATPAERATWPALAPARRVAFLRLFWARREPDLRTRINERIGEHFRRMAEAQRVFALLHPNSRFHHSAIRRRVTGLGFAVPPDRELGPVIARARAETCVADLPSVRDARYAAGYTDVVDTSRGERTVNLEDGLDDRGRIWVRHGQPDTRAVHGLDGETWCYYRQDGVFRVTFLRLSGDQVVRPVREGEAESARYLLATDRPRMRNADLRFRFWPASFRASSDGSLTELLIFPDSLSAVAVLLDGAGREVARDSAAGRRLRLVAPPGGYALLLDGERAGRAGLWRGSVTLLDYDPDALTVSSLLVAAGDAADREELEAGAPPGLTMRAHEPMRFYAEVYGLVSEAGVARYEARYLFESRSGGFLGMGRRDRNTAIAFERASHVTDGRAVETLVVDPGRLPTGHYRLRLEIVDRVRDRIAASAVLEFDLR